MKTEEQMQFQLDKSGAVLLNSPKGRVVIFRSQIVAIAELEEDNIVRIFYKGDAEPYNITDPFAEVIEKLYG